MTKNFNKFNVRFTSNYAIRKVYTGMKKMDLHSLHISAKLG